MFTGQNSMSTGVNEGQRAFILDFDGTITVKDTIDVLANYGIEWQARKGMNMKGIWEEIVASYERHFEDHVRGYKHAKEDRKTLEQEIAYYRGLREVEERSFGRVSDSGLFKGIGKEAWEGAGREAVEKGDVVVRKGFKEFVEMLKENERIWGIVSVNFSGSFIRGVVGASAGLGKDVVEVLANSSDERGALVGPRSGEKTLTTSDAKLASMKDLLHSWRSTGWWDTSNPVYIGDSGTDIECLTEPGVVGIVMADNAESGLMETMKRIGVEVVHIGEYEESRGNKRYWARDFEEILQSPLLSLK